MSSIRDVYTYSGTFDSELWYIYLFGSIPCRHEYEVKGGQDIDFLKVSIEDLQKHFRQRLTFRKYSYEFLDKTDGEGIETDDDFHALINPSYGGSMCFTADNMVVFMGSSKVTIFYNQSDDYDKICSLAKTLYDEAPKEEEEEKKSKVSLIKVYNGDYYTETAKIKEMNVNVEETYNDDFIPVYKDILQFLDSDRSGIILFYGDCGSGKTSLIRHLCAVHPEEYIIVPNSVATHLGDPELMTFVTDHKGAIFILEDCEQILEDRSDNVWNNAISTILNMSDGLTGDIANIKFICTFNAPVTRIDPALLRKGRCIAKYEFGPLAADKVEILNEKYDLGLTEIKDMTLAEVFNADKTDYTEEKKKKKIGF